VMRVGNGGEEGGVNPWRRLDQREDGQRGDVFEVRAERLPFPGGFGPAFARGVLGGGGVINHAHRGVGLRMLIAGRAGADFGGGTLAIIEKKFRCVGAGAGAGQNCASSLRLRIAPATRQFPGRTTGARHHPHGWATGNLSAYRKNPWRAWRLTGIHSAETEFTSDRSVAVCWRAGVWLPARFFISATARRQARARHFSES